MTFNLGIIERLMEVGGNPSKAINLAISGHPFQTQAPLLTTITSDCFEWTTKAWKTFAKITIIPLMFTGAQTKTRRGPLEPLGKITQTITWGWWLRESWETSTIPLLCLLNPWFLPGSVMARVSASWLSTNFLNLETLRLKAAGLQELPLRVKA